MSRKAKIKGNKDHENRNKPLYKGPFQENPNLLFQNVKKSMRPEVAGPTVNTFSTLDSTTNVLPNEANDLRLVNTGGKRPTKEKSFSISTENIILIIIGFIAAGIGIIVFTHSNKFVSVEKDIDYLKEDSKEQKELIKSVDQKATNIDRKVDLLIQKVDFKTENSKH
jgi:hypothetical protein